jgi:hypothetical protein
MIVEGGNDQSFFENVSVFAGFRLQVKSIGQVPSDNTSWIIGMVEASINEDLPFWDKVVVVQDFICKGLDYKDVGKMFTKSGRKSKDFEKHWDYLVGRLGPLCRKIEGKGLAKKACSLVLYPGLEGLVLDGKIARNKFSKEVLEMFLCQENPKKICKRVHPHKWGSEATIDILVRSSWSYPGPQMGFVKGVITCHCSDLQKQEDFASGVVTSLIKIKKDSP